MDTWKILQIEPTSDERAIKRAYAARLKVTSPEVDPDGYMELREAYETAKGFAAATRHHAQVEAQQAAENAAASNDSAESSPPDASPRSPQYEALDELFRLLKGGDGPGFLRALERALASDLFATLDARYDLIGNVAMMLSHAETPDPELSAQVAELIEARDHENPFEGRPAFWYAYAQLLENYSKHRAAQTNANDDMAAMPGYLHVRHVLTAPFDAERLSALMRSQSYHRIAEHILERAKVDDTINIPAANREWWERTTMRGLFTPEPDPEPQPQPQPAFERQQREWGFGLPLGFVIFIILTLGRVFSSISSDPTPPPPEALRGTPMVLQEAADQLNARQLRQLSSVAADLGCDPITQQEIERHLRNAEFRRFAQRTIGMTPSREASAQQQFDAANAGIGLEGLRSDTNASSGLNTVPPPSTDGTLQKLLERCSGVPGR